MLTGFLLDCKQLREISPQAAKKAILQLLKRTKVNVIQTAKLLNTTRRTVYKAYAQ